MALFNIKKLKAVAQEAAGAVTETAQGVAQTATKAIKDANIPDQVNNVLKSDGKDEVESTNQAPDAVCVKDALSMFYYLMSADGALEQGELDKFNSICDEWGKSSIAEKSFITSQCEKEMQTRASSISPLVTTMACVDAVLYSPGSSANDKVNVTPKLLIWNMLAIAYGDDAFDDAERELIKHVAQHYGISDAIILQMEDAMLALMDLEREQRWVKTTTRPYLVIEEVVNEIEKRKAAVFEGAQALIAL